jgi:hypothetical protein
VRQLNDEDGATRGQDVHRQTGSSNVHRESSKAIPCSETEAVPRMRSSTALGYQSLLVLADFRLPTLLAV